MNLYEAWLDYQKRECYSIMGKIRIIKKKRFDELFFVVAVLSADSIYPEILGDVKHNNAHAQDLTSEKL